MSKIDIIENIDTFLCPLCGTKLKVYDHARVACKNRHSFDISRKGYVNLLPCAVKANYDKEMFEARRLTSRSGFFLPMTEHIERIISSWICKCNAGKLKLLDAGCGEGSHLAQIAGSLSSVPSLAVLGFGIDISKYGIQLASRDYPGIAWCVSDLARLPFAPKQFDIVLNILSPSNYSEFNRVISDGGILIKVIPGQGYLKELRSFFHGDTDKKAYSNEKVIEHFKHSFEIFHMQQLQYTVSPDKASFGHIISMTPLSWDTGDEKRHSLLNSNIGSISAAFTIIVGTKKKRV